VNELDADVEKASRALVDEANNRGGEDNITVLLLRFEDPS
jgi:serine/threonine protein phosphatase PrpC